MRSGFSRSRNSRNPTGLRPNPLRSRNWRSAARTRATRNPPTSQRATRPVAAQSSPFWRETNRSSPRKTPLRMYPAVADLPPAAGRPIDFDRDVRPLFVQHCYACHGPDKQKGGLRLDRKADALKGGDDGPVIVRGKAAESPLVRLTAGLEADRVMP